MPVFSSTYRPHSESGNFSRVASMRLLFLSPALTCLLLFDASGQQQRYDHGDPTAYEQYMMELVNTARANPSAEAARLGVGLNDGLAAGQISTNVKAPLAFHPQLLEAARGHSDWMLATGIFNHTGVDGTTPTQRAARLGYPFGVAENIAYRSTSRVLNDSSLAGLTRVIHDNLFRSATHRRNLLDGSYAVVGHGLRTGRFGGFNAAMTTQNFSDGGASIDSGPFITGVAYNDRNGNKAYDPGEGIAGLEVRPALGAYFAVTSGSGGYAIPVVPLQTNSETVNLPFAVGGTAWENTLTHEEAFREQKLAAAEAMSVSLTWSGGVLSAPVTKTLTMLRPVRINYRLLGTDGIYYDRTMVTMRSVRANLDITGSPARVEQGVVFSPLASQVYVPGRTVQLRARASSGLPVVFSSSDKEVAEIQNGKLVVRGAGTATITARQEGDASYLPAEATCVLLVRKARQTIIFPSPARPPFSTGATFELSARATQGGSVTYAAQPEGIVSISGSTVTMLAPGKVKIIATQSGTPNYEAVSVPKTLMFR
jgi:uncharacterized protein YkwD